MSFNPPSPGQPRTTAPFAQARLVLAASPMAEPRTVASDPARAGRIAIDQTRALLTTAADGGIRHIEARPGDVERVLGQSWPFPSPFGVSVRTLPASEGIARVEARARQSLERMGLPRGDTLIVGQATDLLGAEGGALWARLEGLKAAGLYRRIGFRARMSDGPLLLARRFNPDVVQVPASLLDQRAIRTGLVESLATLGIEVQLCSVFHGGAIFAPSERLLVRPSEADMAMSRLRRRLAEARLDPMQATLAFALNQPGVAKVVVGAASAAELRALMAAACASAPDLDWSAFAAEDMTSDSDDSIVSAA